MEDLKTKVKSLYDWGFLYLAPERELGVFCKDWFAFPDEELEYKESFGVLLSGWTFCLRVYLF
jgi:hypothetical protein